MKIEYTEEIDEKEYFDSISSKYKRN